MDQVDEWWTVAGSLYGQKNFYTEAEALAQYELLLRNGERGYCAVTHNRVFRRETSLIIDNVAG